MVLDQDEVAHLPDAEASRPRPFLRRRQPARGRKDRTYAKTAPGLRFSAGQRRFIGRADRI